MQTERVDLTYTYPTLFFLPLVIITLELFSPFFVLKVFAFPIRQLGSTVAERYLAIQLSRSCAFLLCPSPALEKERRFLDRFLDHLARPLPSLLLNRN